MDVISSALTRRRLLMVLGAAIGARAAPMWAGERDGIAPQPFFASVMRAVKALADAGQPIAEPDAEQLARFAVKADAKAVAQAEALLNRYTLARVVLDKEGMGTATFGGADRTLIEQGWKSFLVRISNPQGLTEKFDVAVANPIWAGSGAGKMSQPDFPGDAHAGIRDTLLYGPLIEKTWLAAQAQVGQPLSGGAVEYQVVDLFSRDRGARKGKLGFAAGMVQSGDRFYSRAMSSAYTAPLLFDTTALPTEEVMLRILDDDGIACMASLIIKDARDHIYPPQVMRLAPDMFFHPHIYRADGETVRLPDGEYSIATWRGPEYVRQHQTVRVGDGNRQIAIKLKRWINPALWGWYSGDTHIHAAGCAHYTHPTEGVTPQTMIRHVRGEALDIGDVLTWGPAWYHQKQFFTGQAISPEAGLEYADLQQANNANLKPNPTPKDHESLLRYDIEVSQFPSSFSGHAILLRLKEQDYPGTQALEDWPSWNLPILQWGKRQGALVGFAHCSSGMGVSTTAIPNYEIPPFDGVGTNEAIVDITHDACDFLSGCEWEPASELNAWYHMLNCGFRLAMVGETDYPCMSGERPGVGRSYVKLDQRPVDDAGYNQWIEGIRAGRLYCGDGRSHILQMTVNNHPLGGEDVQLQAPGVIRINATLAARIEPAPNDETRAIKDGWHLERARMGESRNVPLELIVNGESVERLELLADGKPRPIRFKTRLERSSWVALRILPSVHSHPIFVTVGGKPIRASRRSAQWLRNCVDALWEEKHRLMRESERPAAAEGYDHARRIYDRIIAESEGKMS